MVKASIKYVHEDTDRHGNVRLYFHKRGVARKIRLPGPMGTPKFWETYRAAASGERPPERTPARPAAPGSDSLRWLCIQYFGSAEFRKLSPRTRYVRRGIIERTCTEHGEKPYAQLAPRHLRRLRDDMADRPSASRLAELGCSAHEIQAITGHRTLKEIERYTRAADQRRLADRAMQRLAQG